MQNKVITHFLQHKIMYAIGAVILVVTGFALFQTPDFNQSALTGNVGSVVSEEGLSVTFPEKGDVTLAERSEVTFSVVTEAGATVSTWIVDTKGPGFRPDRFATVTADTTGMAVATGVLPNRVTDQRTYQLGVMITSGGERLIAVSDYDLIVVSEDELTNEVTDSVTAEDGLVTLVTSEGKAVTVTENDEVTLTLPATSTEGFTVTLQSNDASLAPVKIASAVKGVFSFKVTNDVTGAYNLVVTDSAGVTVNGVTVTVTDVTTGVTSSVTTGVSDAVTVTGSITEPVTSTLESSVTEGNKVSFTTPGESTVSVNEPMVVNVSSSIAGETFTLYSVDATGEREVLVKKMGPDENVTVTFAEAGVYNLVVTGSNIQAVSEVTVTVSGSEIQENAGGSVDDKIASSTVTVMVETTAGDIDLGCFTDPKKEPTDCIPTGESTAADPKGGKIELCPPGSNPLCGIDKAE